MEMIPMITEMILIKHFMGMIPIINEMMHKNVIRQF